MGADCAARAFLRRLGVLVAAAAAVSLVTWLVMPNAWVRFGILHSVAAGSVLALPALRLHWGATALLGAALLLAGRIEIPALGGPGFVWLGLSHDVPPMIDWEPVVPWAGPVLLGLAAAKAADAAGWVDRLRGWPAGPAWDRLGWPGRHSLAVYLLHQPVIFGALLLWARLAG